MMNESTRAAHTRAIASSEAILAQDENAEEHAERIEALRQYFARDGFGGLVSGQPSRGAPHVNSLAAHVSAFLRRLGLV